MKPRIHQVLLDFDGVLAHYRHPVRIAHLAAHAGCEHERVRDVLFVSGLELEYDSGTLDTATYLRRLGEGLGATIDEDAWIAARMAGSTTIDEVLTRLAAVHAEVAMGVLTNNGAMMTQAIPRIVAPLAPRIEGRVLTSGGLQRRKPAPTTFTHALDLLGWDASSTLFVDDLFTNVQGAREAGLHAETVTDGRSLGKALKRYVFGPQTGW
ncbi:HAD-IA family hydrolase [Pseudoxanthomonas sp.]|jgi:putative hydrolase of the HAD superfamily|uniref:HAD-IA family hydrolase n=1 Tax=Pseudoxanthomonas sp. TaxID=1871049 RepID=UPI002E122141|nr:HAD-IA family hydrolase [Pseudoxanthomonas sp.]